MSFLNTLVITSKSKICFNTDKACDPEECKFAKGYFDRVDEAIISAHKQYQIKNKVEIETIAKEYEICPFEFSLISLCHLM